MSWKNVHCLGFLLIQKKKSLIIIYFITKILHLLDILKGNNKPDVYACHIKLNSTYVKRIRP